MIKTSSKAGLIPIFALSLWVAGFLSAAEIVQGKWAATPPDIDGQIEEWQGQAMAVQKSVGVEYAVRNDGANLYLLFVFKNPKYLSSIEMTGLTLYADTSGKKGKDYGVKFVKKTVNGAQLIDYMEKQGQPLAEERKREIIDKPQFLFYKAAVLSVVLPVLSYALIPRLSTLGAALAVLMTYGLGLALTVLLLSTQWDKHVRRLGEPKGPVIQG